MTGPHNPSSFDDSCVFVAVARLLRTTPEWVSETSEWWTGNVWLSEACDVIRSAAEGAGRQATIVTDGSRYPPAGVTNEYGMLYHGVGGNCHAVNVERVGNQWWIYDYTDISGRLWRDWNEVASVAAIFWL